MPKSTENTVFVRFVPTPSQKLPRHQLESIFSEVGPIKKTSWIQSENNSSKGYGFVKYLSSEDADTASSSLNGSKISVDGKEYKLLVELATLDQDQSRGKKPSQAEKVQVSNPSQPESGEASETANNEFLKKKSRIIIRNLSFYAKENHIRSMLEKKFGKVVEVHLPRVQSNLHVGFCFVTFADPEIAQRAVEAKTLDIQKRIVTMEWSVPKKEHQQQKQANSKPKEAETTKLFNEGKSTHETIASESNASEEVDEDAEETHDDEGDGEEAADDDSKDDSSVDSMKSDTALTEGRTVFLRNLPFDTSRKDLFDLFAKYGYIESIYLVKDKETQMLKGTAFVTYKRSKNAQMAVAAASEQKEASTPMLEPAVAGSELVLKGRKILANMAVDKETADTFASKEHNAPAADRRNMYLQAEARVESTPTDGSDKANTWEDIPDQDQKKRQTALKDKTTKLHSPIFFINPKRLSFRNLAKHVDEVQLRILCERGTKKGLQAGLVSAKDYIAHLRAEGEITTREVLSMVQEKNKSGEAIIVPWEETKKSIEYIPSVYIDRDVGSATSKAKGTSRGFGFVEFTYHVHALACLRELNNNPSYSREYVAGGKNAVDMKRKGKKPGVKGSNVKDVRIPRLIVDFTVENRVKAKKQDERRLQQKLNNEKQRQAVQETKVDDGGNSKKRSRGAIQRAKNKQKKTDTASSGEGQSHEQKSMRRPQIQEASEPYVPRKKAKASVEAPTKPTQAKSVVSESPSGHQDQSKKRWFE